MEVWIRIILLSILPFTSCAERIQFVQQEDLIPKTDTIKQYSLEKTSIRVANDTNDVLLSYFTFSNEIDSQKIISLTEKYYFNIVQLESDLVTKIKLPIDLREIIKRTKPILQFCQYNDSIYYFLLKDSLVNWNIRNNNIQTKKLKLPNDFSHGNHFLSSNLVSHFGFQLYYQDNYLHFGSYLNDKKGGNWIFNITNYPYQVNLALNDSSSCTSKFTFPNYVSENYYGLKFNTYRLNTNIGDIISFPISGNLYHLQMQNDSIYVIGGKSKFQTNKFIAPICSQNQKHQISSDSDWYYYTHTEYYSNLIYNTNTNQYYRLYYHTLPLKNKEGLYYTTRDRKISVQVFDKDFTLIHEEVLKNMWFVLHFIPYKFGFAINNNGIDPKLDHYDYLYYEVKSK